MKKVFLSILLIFLPKLASGYTGEAVIDGLKYYVVTKGNTAAVRGIAQDNTSNSIVIPETIEYDGVLCTVTSIGNGAFSQCIGLASIIIPNSVTSIGDYAFHSCSGLASVAIPNSVTSIGSDAFSSCRGLTSVTIGNSVTSIGERAFDDCSDMASVAIPNSVTSIGGSAFRKCTALTSVTIPNSVTSIGDYTFFGCSSLTSVTIPNSVTSIGKQAFSGCKALTSVTIGSDITKINSSAFSSCLELTDVYCSAEKLRSSIYSDEGLYTYTNAFDESYAEYATLHVPASALNDYKNMEPWKSFMNIVAIGDGEIPETLTCAKPEITIVEGQIEFSCETEGVEFISEVSVSDAKNYYDKKINAPMTFTVSVYATKAGYNNSEKVTTEFNFSSDIIKSGDVNGDGVVNVADHVKLSDIILNQ